MRICFYVTVSFCVTTVLSQNVQNVRLRIENTHMEPCLHVKNKQIIRNNSGTFDVQSTNVNLDKFGTAKITKLQFVDEKGSVKYLTVPGCYNIRLDTTFTESINHPYIESFVKVENDEICKKTRPNPYCSQTTHLGVRLVANNQVTCKFCDLCVTANEVGEGAKRNSPNLSIKTNNQICTENGQRIQAGVEYPLELTNVCTPSSNDLEHQIQQQLGINWREAYKDYIKRGSIQFMVHILNRRNPVPTACLELGAGTYKWQGPANLQDRVMENLKSTCRPYLEPLADDRKPKDDYLACYYGYVNYAIENL